MKINLKALRLNLQRPMEDVMSTIIDARGLACPEPVIRTKRGLEHNNYLEVLVDNNTALENVRRMAASSGCFERYESETGGSYRIYIEKKSSSDAGKPEESVAPIQGETVIVISSDVMGKGDDELGKVLMKAYVHTLNELDSNPDKIILYNSGVKLAVHGEQSCDDLNELIKKGAIVLVCGTCANHFGIKDKISAGSISNMFDIAGTMMKAGRLVCP